MSDITRRESEDEDDDDNEVNAAEDLVCDEVMKAENTPPANVERWIKNRLAQCRKMLEYFHGNVEIKKKAEYLLVEILGLCELVMGNPTKLQWLAERNAINPSTNQPYKSIPDQFAGKYAYLGSPSAWACFALQQAFFEYNHGRFECGDEDAASKWHIRELHAHLTNFKSDRFESSTDGARLNTNAGTRAFRGAEQAINGQTETQRRLRLDSLGEDPDLIEKAKVFEHAYKLRFSDDEYVFCPSIVKLEAPSVVSFEGSGRSKSGTFVQKQAEFASRTSAAAKEKSGTNLATAAPTIPGIAPVKRKNDGNVVTLTATKQKKRAKKAASSAAAAADDAAADQNVQAMQAAKQSGSFIGDHFRDKAIQIAVSREMIRKTAKNVAEAACYNVIKGLVGATAHVVGGSGADDGMDVMQRLEMDKRQWQARMDEIGMRVRIQDDSERDGTVCELKLAQLSDEDRTFFLRSREPELDLSKLALENQLRAERMEGATPLLFKSKKKVNKKAEMIQKKVGVVPKFEDYALAFGFGSAKEARSFLNSVELRRSTVIPGQKVSYSHQALQLKPWEYVFITTTVDYITPGLKCQMNRDIIEFQKRYNEIVHRMRSKKWFERMPTKYAHKNVIKDQKGYEARLQENLDAKKEYEERQAARQAQIKAAKERKQREMDEKAKARMQKNLDKQRADVEKMEESEEKKRRMDELRQKASVENMNAKLAILRARVQGRIRKFHKEVLKLLRKGPPESDEAVYLFEPCVDSSGAYLKNNVLKPLCIWPKGSYSKYGRSPRKKRDLPQNKVFGFKVRGYTERVEPTNNIPDAKRLASQLSSKQKQSISIMKELATEMEEEMQQDAKPAFRFKRSNKRPRLEAAQEEVIFESGKFKGKVVYYMADIVEHPGGSREAEEARARIQQNPYPAQIVIGGRIRDAHWAS